MSDFDDEIIAEFLVEGRESLDQLDRDLVLLEDDPEAREVLDRIFRNIHTIKGTCGFMGFSRLEGTAHIGENLLSTLRDGAFAVTPDIITGLLKMVDAIRNMMEAIEETGADGENDYAELKAELTVLLENGGKPKAAEAAPPEPAPAPAPAPEPVVEAAPAPKPEPAPKPAAPAAEASGGDALKMQLLAELGLDDAEINAVMSGDEATGDAAPAAEAPKAPEPAPAPARTAAEAQANDIFEQLTANKGVELGTVEVAEARASAPTVDDNPMGDLNKAVANLIDQIQGESAAPVASAISTAAQDAQQAADKAVKKGPAPKKEASAPARSGNSRRANESIRVDVNLLDQLMNMVGELVLIRNQVLQATQDHEDSALTTATQRLNLVTSDLQEGVMKTRMQPIGNVWSKFPRVVRDLSITCGKRVRVEMEGKETELDKSLIEAIKDPLTHLIRNSVDHGIEPPHEREKSGKDPEGHLLLRAYHESGKVNIEIVDDGGGIRPDKIKAKALEKGLITEEQAAGMKDQEIHRLVFHPGFSTAEKVTNVSGRGVGMDVVRSNIEKIGGTVDVHSEVGKGTTFLIKIPLTLAIVPALIVGSAEQRYAVPQVALQELVRLDPEEIKKSVEYIKGTPVYRLRGNLLPLVFLRDLLGQSKESYEDQSMRIVVLHADDRIFGLVVDAINDTQDIVVKPLSRHLKTIGFYAGATIMGDGKVALILDVLGAAQEARVLGDVRQHGNAGDGDDEMSDSNGETLKLLLVRSPDDGRQAIPLAMVSRLEEIAASSVEYVGDQRVVQYRGDILPLAFVSDVLPERRAAFRTDEADGAEQMLNVVVYTEAGRSIGLVVEQIEDVVEASLEGIQPGSRLGVSGVIVVRERVTELLDVRAVIQAADPSFYASVRQTAAHAEM